MNEEATPWIFIIFGPQAESMSSGTGERHISSSSVPHFRTLRDFSPLLMDLRLRNVISAFLHNVQHKHKTPIASRIAYHVLERLL